MSKIIYLIDEDDDKINIFGANFVKNNKDKCIIIYKDMLFPFEEYFYINDIEKNDEKLEILLIEFEEIYDKSYMFYRCEALEKFPIFKNIGRSEKEINENKTSEEKEFDTEYSNKYIDLISNCKNNKIASEKIITSDKDFESFSSKSIKPSKTAWNISICKNMSYMFYGCSSLISLPDISKWNINSANNMSFLFSGCSSLESLPDISNWNTSNVTNMSYMFNGCSSLVSLPDISKWNINNVTNISFMFSRMFFINILT